MPEEYNCGWGCKSYNSLCDACDSYMYEFEGWKSEKQVEEGWKKANRGVSPYDTEDDEDER